MSNKKEEQWVWLYRNVYYINKIVRTRVVVKPSTYWTVKLETVDSSGVVWSLSAEGVLRALIKRGAERIYDLKSHIVQEEQRISEMTKMLREMEAGNYNCVRED